MWLLSREGWTAWFSGCDAAVSIGLLWVYLHDLVVLVGMAS